MVGKLGTSTVSTVELENAIHGRAETGFGIMSESQLKMAVAHAKARGEKNRDDERLFRHSSPWSCLLFRKCS